MTECCEKCIMRNYDLNKGLIEISCRNISCPCHSKDEEDTKGGVCSKCGAWKGGDYGMDGAGVFSRHTCPEDDGLERVLGEFDGKFAKGIFLSDSIDGEELKSFITQVYQKAKEEERERIRKELPEEKEEGQTEQCKDVMAMNYLIGKNKGWNDCLDQVKKII